MRRQPIIRAPRTRRIAKDARDWATFEACNIPSKQELAITIAFAVTMGALMAAGLV